MLCPNCGADLENLQSEYCPKCGLRVKEPEPVKPPETKKKTSPAAIGFLIGLALIIIVGIFVIVTQFIIPGLNAPDTSDEPTPRPPSYAEELPADSTAPAIETQMPVEEEVTEATPLFYMGNCVGREHFSLGIDLTTAGCTPEFVREYNDEFPVGTVYAQSIPEGTPVYADTHLILYVSDGPDAAPEGYNQKLVLTAPAGSSYGTLTLYNWQDGQWYEKYSCSATLGINGIGYDYGEGRKMTPQGNFKLGLALSANGIANNDWPFMQVNGNVCAVDDPASPLYNTIQDISAVPSGVSYDPIGSTLVNGFSSVCVYIEHNGDGLTSDNVVPGRGSVITLCGRLSDIKPTLGCVDIAHYDMDALLLMLDYSKNPHIEIYPQ